MTTRKKKVQQAERAARQQRAEQARQAERQAKQAKQAQQAEARARQEAQRARQRQQSAQSRPAPGQTDPRRAAAQTRRARPQNPQQRPQNPQQRPQNAPRPEQGQAARARMKKEHVRITKAEMRRRRIRRRILALCCLLFAIAAVVLLSVTMLFRVDRFEFQTMDGKPGADTGSYTQAEILQALEVKQGDNLFSFSTEEQAQLLDTQFPLLENVEVLRRMPSTVILRMQPAQESFTIQTPAGWLILSRQCKVMAMSGTQPDLPLLIGPVQTVPQIGETLALGVETPQTTPLAPTQSDAPSASLSPTEPPREHVAMADVLTVLDQYGILDEVTHLDLTDPEQVYFGYQDRIKVTLGTLNRLDYKVKFAVHLLLNKEGNGLTETDRGILDMSIIRADGSLRPTFKQCDPGLPPRQPVDPPADPDKQTDTPADGAPPPEDSPQPDGTAAPDATAAPEEPTAAPTATPEP